MRTSVENVRYARAAEFATRRVANEVILVPFRGRSADLSHIFQLNEVAACVWDALESPTTVDDLVGKVTGEFEVEADKARQDVVELLEAFEKAELVRAEGSGG